jgi:hypothetical protein
MVSSEPMLDPAPMAMKPLPARVAMPVKPPLSVTKVSGPAVRPTGSPAQRPRPSRGSPPLPVRWRSLPRQTGRGRAGQPLPLTAWWSGLGGSSPSRRIAMFEIPAVTMGHTIYLHNVDALLQHSGASPDTTC